MAFRSLLQFVVLSAIAVNANPIRTTYSRVAYVWTGNAAHTSPDFIATISLDNATFGKVISTSPAPTTGNEPHHIGFNSDNTVLATGGLLSLLSGQPGIFLWDLSNPLQPKFQKTIQTTSSAATDEIKPRVGGGFWITDMGAADGSSPGRLVEVQPDMTTFTEWPANPPPVVNATDGLNPHGFSIDTVRGNIITVDYVDPASTLIADSPGPALRDTIRIWDLATRTIKSTIYIPNAGGIMDVQHLNNDPLGRAIVTAVGSGIFYLVNPATATYTVAYNTGTPNIGAAYIAQTKSGKYIYITLTNQNRVIVLDATNPTAMKRIDTGSQPLVGPHYCKLTSDEKQILISDYFLQEGSIGYVNSVADYKVWAGDIQPNGNVVFNPTKFVDFSKVFSTGVGHPHGIAIMDL